MRGCFQAGIARDKAKAVFPAHAGVFPCDHAPRVWRRWSSPRMRGCFRPPVRDQERRQSSPRMRGCFPVNRVFDTINEVFPAHAGVFPSSASKILRPKGLPRACGGVSKPSNLKTFPTKSSPRMRGCFFSAVRIPTMNRVFPAHAGVFPTTPRSCPTARRLPRACGGVSSAAAAVESRGASSPRMRGCFRDFANRQQTALVFPAHAGVFPPGRDRPKILYRLPRACGGVSSSANRKQSAIRSSPRMRGCFCNRRYRP